MKFDKKEVLHLAKLAKLNIKDEEVESYNHELQAILNYIENINSLNLDQVTESLRGIEGEGVGPRPDSISPSTPQIIGDAGQKDGQYVATPQVFNK
ncbi:MAG: hypothetical protein A2406_01245 [Candidatus Komeilibacteria bacterium RIFOXYC1_FULL_37_11]|uniref:Aspartyl/glutamyl-tRNA(Asn/Gln) amidotransferase subunit C n=1 Tax=Candidatus Komeilibacteria bacterium RIFOXYC1_FULL_37_11 TaxID=1798555 RepID=A0A1G2BW36_9BACT|nr:MAG: hypothetical protein A2406_01245 [Candidatus Komeilibacteria bacterium RIFOXYC1_FULL_37_11]OGY95771.1 MAG: hypothetical protein A2611_03270 [Candidatus Komeilibacteria bacterium RIFOXYD1_FULL_37_29]OGY96427.1 MAG: hypothetical protein A2543_01290 [Candidatus Komeilibacteria bacterium RIFOXYD2_FULL_37_8]